MPSPLAGFQLDVPRSPVVQLVKLLTNPKRAISKRIFICFGRYRSVNEPVDLTIIYKSRRFVLNYSMPPDPLAVFLRIFHESPSLIRVHEKWPSAFPGVPPTFVHTTPSSRRTHLIADLNHPINRGEIIADLPRLKIQLSVAFFDRPLNAPSWVTQTPSCA
jgi:hypothetical protein